MLKKQKSKDILSKYVPKDFTLSSIADRQKHERVATPYYYIALYLTVERSVDVAGVTAECVKILLMRKGIVHAIISTFIFVSFEASDAEALMLKTNDDLLEKFKEKIKIVCGKTETFYANLGCETSLRYSLVMPNLDKVLKLLTTTEGGKSVQCDI